MAHIETVVNGFHVHQNGKLAGKKLDEPLLPLQKSDLILILNLVLFQNIVVMVIGATCFASALGYMAYMRYKYEKMGYYVAQKEDGSEMFTKKRSKWE